MPLTLLLLASATVALAAQPGYVGREVCAGCHKEIAATQCRTNMARTYHDPAVTQLPAKYAETFQEGPAPGIDYAVQKTGQELRFRVQMPSQPALDFPVASIVGGERHGLVFLFQVPDLEGLALPRVPLIEGRYFNSTLKHGLALELGLPEDKPTTYETSMGRVLPPSLQSRCLTCHTAPRTYGKTVESGVSCESCHGPGQPHLSALSLRASDLAILNPAKLPIADRMQPCSQCHAGTVKIEDPMPDETIISSQVTALKNTECWRQTAGDLTCTNCHNPHQDATRAVLIARSEKTCARCHSAATTRHAALCPVNRSSGCVECHMPMQTRGAFIMADHWIRVPTDHKGTPSQKPEWRSTLTPRHVYLRMIATDDRKKAAELRDQIVSGASFFDLATKNSNDRATGVNGGYLGDLDSAQLDAAWSVPVLKLQPGDISEPIEARGQYLIFQRMPLNFRFDSKLKFEEAMKLRTEGRRPEAAAMLIEALKIYPQSLRALTYLGITYGELGNPQTASKILAIAARLYPNDEGAHFNLGIAYGATGNDEEMQEYERTIEIDPDYVPAYLNLGAALFAKGQYEDAVKRYREGLNVNPLNAPLHYSLSVALDKVNRTAEAQSEAALASRIDSARGGH